MSGNSILLVLVSSVTSLSIIVFFLFKARRSALFYSFVFYQIMVLINIIPMHQILISMNISNAVTHYVLCDGFLFFAYCFTGISWIIFCIFYTGNSKLNNRFAISCLILFSICFFSFSMYFRYMNRFHFMKEDFWGRLARDVYGEALLLKVIVSSFFMGFGIILLLAYGFRRKGYLRIQALALAACVFVPLAIILLEAYYNRDFANTPQLIRINDLICMGYAFSSLLIVFITFRYRFMNIVPAALRKAAQNIRECMIITDRYGCISFFNDSFLTAFGKYLGGSGATGIREFAENLGKDAFGLNGSNEPLAIMKNGCREKFSGRIGINPPPSGYFDVSIEPLKRKDGRILGSVITFSNITEYQVLLDEIGHKCSELDAANTKLSAYAAVSEELAAVKERNRVAREIHDSLGYTMTLLISLIEVACRMCEENPGGVKEKLTQTAAIARDGLEQVRNSVAGLASGRQGLDDLGSKLQFLAEGFRQSGINVNYRAYGLDDKIKVPVKEAVYRICQEAMTNSMKHGKAKNVEIVVRQVGDILKLFILDDGCGCGKIVKGFGLAGMELRVRNLNGYISYGSGEGGGFNIHVEIPADCETEDARADVSTERGEADGKSASC